ncbi:activating signal cointegrator 1 [Panulirus ornatus]|uniref:activating signal cointegrator 1 n=1 Tax=Panulirus ornatus TaxID=150431 RepID=UPI003A89979E
MASIEKWACEELEKLGIPDPGDIVRYLQPNDSPSEVQDYLTSMLDVKQPSHKKFIEEFLKKQEEAKSSVDSRFYRKPDLEENVGLKNNDNKKKQKSPKENGVTSGKSQKDVPSNASSAVFNSTPCAGKKKPKFVNLYSDEGQNRDVVLLSGRHKCDCQASKHRLINNCLKCGRIVCEQEGSGPCQFCGDLVITKEEKEVLCRGSRKSEALQKKLFSEKNAIVNEAPVENGQLPDHLKKAIEHKNRLLEFDRTSEKRTRVFDDESDYFNINSRWLSHEDKVRLQKREEELREKRFDRNCQTVTIDFFGRKVILDDKIDGIYDPNDPLVKEILEGKTSDIFSAPNREESSPQVEVNRPEYTDTGSIVGRKHSNSKFSNIGISLRIQDRELQEMTDEGMCLSMHQPWASLLVAGIKMHEGRMWYSPHRGRLWIAAAAKVPTQEEIRQVEHMHLVLHNDENLEFPQHYPTGCLLGCVDVSDVLPQEEYRNLYPDGESDSPYVFICENPQEMILKFPMKGKHKIYKMDPKIHQAAKKALRPKEE